MKPIVKWPIPIIGKLADNRYRRIRIIGHRLSADNRCTSKIYRCACWL